LSNFILLGICTDAPPPQINNNKKTKAKKITTQKTKAKKITTQKTKTKRNHPKKH